MAGGKAHRSNSSCGSNTNKGEKQSTPILTRGRNAAENAAAKRYINGEHKSVVSIGSHSPGKKSDNNSSVPKTSGSSTPARAVSLSCGDSFELLERKLLKSISQTMSEQFAEMQQYISAKFKEIVDSFNAEIFKLQSTCDDLHLEVNGLRGHIEELRRQQRLSDAIITGIPYTSNKDPLQIVTSIATAIGVSLPARTFAYRPKHAKGAKNLIIIKFPSACEQRYFLERYRCSGPIKLGQVSADFSSNGNVGVYESLTENNHRILREALKFRRQKLLHSAVTRNGLVLVRANGDSRWQNIPNIAMLCQFRTGKDTAEDCVA